jgi:hypothetical protein
LGLPREKCKRDGHFLIAKGGVDLNCRPEVALVPEIAAAVAGFARSNERENEMYAMVDIGAGTLDCCTFNLGGVDGEARCSVFAADVSMLGVEPWEVARTDDELAPAFANQVLSLVSQRY